MMNPAVTMPPAVLDPILMLQEEPIIAAESPVTAAMPAADPGLGPIGGMPAAMAGEGIEGMTGPMSGDVSPTGVESSTTESGTSSPGGENSGPGGGGPGSTSSEGPSGGGAASSDGDSTSGDAYFEGGPISGSRQQDSMNLDEIVIRVQPDEYVIPEDVVQIMGPEFFDKLLEAFHTPGSGAAKVNKKPVPNKGTKSSPSPKGRTGVRG
jgi:hypothetical protein